MRFTILLLVFAGIIVAQTARAGRFEFGPQVGISLPSGDTADGLDQGMNAGVTTTFMETRAAGIGVDFGYHRWPGSSYLNAVTDGFFSQLSATPITGSK